MERKRYAYALGVCLAGAWLLQGCYGLDDETIAKLGSFTVTPVTGLATTEGGGTATFTVVLDRQPSAAVSVSMASSVPGEAAVTTVPLTFTPADWSVAQTVTVTGVDDSVDDGAGAFVIVLSPAVSADYHYAGVDPADAAGSNADDDAAGVTVAPTSGLSTTESGGTASFSVVLDAEPTADVTIAISSDNINEGTVSTPSLLFTPLTWMTPQFVTITGVDDGAVADLDVAYSIVTGAAVSADPNYSGLPVADVFVTNTDNDAPGVTVTPVSGLVTTELGATATFSVVLNTLPAGNVVLDVATLTAAEGLVSTGLGLPAASLQLTFTSGNWDSAQVVTVTGVDDALPAVDGHQPYTIQITTDAGATADPLYDPINPADVDVLNLDDDVAGITVTPIVLTTIEGGTTVGFTVALNTVPAAPVTIGVASLDSSEGAVSTPTLIFPANGTALTAQTVTVTPVDDALTDGARVYTVELTADLATLDTDYNGLNPEDVVVTNNDNDVPGITVTPTSLTTSEAGTASSFTVVLDSIPAAQVVITLTGLVLSEGSLSTATLTFDPNGSALTPQTVTVTGLDDVALDGAVMYTLTGSASSTDPDYNTLPFFTVDVTNNDDDTSPPGASPGPGTLVLAPSVPAAYDDKRLTEPCVLTGGLANFVLWFEGSNGAGQKHEQVGLATSPDPVTWTKNPASPVLSHSGVNSTIDKTGVGDPCVLFDGAATYTMWFGCRENAAQKTKIGRATSTNGIDWTKYSLSPGGPTATILTGTAGTFDVTGVASPHVLLDAATYKMWYQGLDGGGVYRIGYATSTDGITWTKNPGAVLDLGAPGSFDDGGVSTPCVLKDGAVYRMWYVGRDDSGPTGRQRMGYAQSPDGITWTKYAGNPILGLGAPGTFDDTRLWSPWVIKDLALPGFHIWYAAEDAAGNIRLAYTTSP